jgi:hypothetical protein
MPAATQPPEARLYIFITILLGLMITGFGVGVALCLRMPRDTRYDRHDVD